MRDAEARLAEEGGAAPSVPALYELVLTAGERSETLRLYPAGAEGHAAERAGRSARLLLSADAVDDLVAKIEAARTAEPLPPPEAGDEGEEE